MDLKKRRIPMAALKTFRNSVEEMKNKIMKPPTEIEKTQDNYDVNLLINDLPMPVKLILLKPSKLDEISTFSGASASVKGRYIPPEEESDASNDQFLHLHIEGSNKQSILLALQMIQRFAEESVGPEENMRCVQVEKVLVGLEKAPREFELTQRVLGPSGGNLQYITSETEAEVSLRGRGSGFCEPDIGKESPEPLHIRIQHSRPEVVQAGRILALHLLETVQQEFEEYCSQQAQLMVAPQPVPVPVQNSPPSSLSDGSWSPSSHNANLDNEIWNEWLDDRASPGLDWSPRKRPFESEQCPRIASLRKKKKRRGGRKHTNYKRKAQLYCDTLEKLHDNTLEPKEKEELVKLIDILKPQLSTWWYVRTYGDRDFDTQYHEIFVKRKEKHLMLKRKIEENQTLQNKEKKKSKEVHSPVNVLRPFKRPLLTTPPTTPYMATTVVDRPMSRPPHLINRLPHIPRPTVTSLYNQNDKPHTMFVDPVTHQNCQNWSHNKVADVQPSSQSFQSEGQGSNSQPFQNRNRNHQVQGNIESFSNEGQWLNSSSPLNCNHQVQGNSKSLPSERQWSNSQPPLKHNNEVQGNSSSLPSGNRFTSGTMNTKLHQQSISYVNTMLYQPPLNHNNQNQCNNQYLPREGQWPNSQPPVNSHFQMQQSRWDIGPPLQTPPNREFLPPNPWQDQQRPLGQGSVLGPPIQGLPIQRQPSQGPPIQKPPMQRSLVLGPSIRRPSLLGPQGQGPPEQNIYSTPNQSFSNQIQPRLDVPPRWPSPQMIQRHQTPEFQQTPQGIHNQRLPFPPTGNNYFPPHNSWRPQH